MRVTVIGAGSIGLCSALALAAEGADVCVVDARDAGTGASSHNAGWVVPSMSAPVPAPGVLTQSLKWMLRPDSPLYISPSLDPSPCLLHDCDASQLHHNEIRIRPAKSDGTQSSDFRAFRRTRAHWASVRKPPIRIGAAVSHTEVARLHAEEMTLVRALGGDEFDVHTSARTAQLIPGLSSSVVGGIVCPHERFLDPAAFVESLITQCESLGVEIVEGTELTLSADSAGNVTASGVERPMTSDHFVVAAGTWSADVVRALGYTLPVQSGKGYGFDVPPIFPSVLGRRICRKPKVAVTPLSGATRLAGTMGFGGRSEHIDKRRAGGILTSAADYFDHWERPQNAVPWTGLRPMTPDGMPIIGRLTHHPNVTVATGHAMLGITLGPVTGELVARSVFGRGLPAYAGVFRPDRFSRTFRSVRPTTR